MNQNSLLTWWSKSLLGKWLEITMSIRLKLGFAIKPNDSHTFTATTMANSLPNSPYNQLEYSPEVQHRYQKWPYLGAGATFFQGPSFWGYQAVSKLGPEKTSIIGNLYTFQFGCRACSLLRVSLFSQGKGNSLVYMEEKTIPLQMVEKIKSNWGEITLL